jgi:hypothetical protein
MHIPSDLSESEEWDAIRRIRGREGKEAWLTWLLGLAEWDVRADLTFASLAGPERAEKAVKRWLCSVAPRAWAVVGYERQGRGAVHAHAIIGGGGGVNLDLSILLWQKIAGWCRVERIESKAGAVAYVVKHTVKDLAVDVWRPCPTVYCELRPDFAFVCDGYRRLGGGHVGGGWPLFRYSGWPLAENT